jgi:DNA polymerase III delta prime subunit
MGAPGFETPENVRPHDGRAADAVTAEERAEWLIDFILLHKSDERLDLIRRAVEQFLAAEAVGYERGRRTE